MEITVSTAITGYLYILKELFKLEAMNLDFASVS